MSYNCKHPFPVQRVAGNYVVCIQCGKQLALANGPINSMLEETLERHGYYDDDQPKLDKHG